MREHGTYARYKLDNCRCYPCCGAGSEYRMNRSRAIAYGTWQPFVDAEPVRRHILYLREANIGTERLADLSNVNRRYLQRLVSGMPGGRQVKRVRPALAQRILTVEPTLENLAPSTLVSSLGSLRRLQALVVIGWSQNKLASKLRMGQRNFCRLMRSTHVTAATALRIRVLFDELWDQQPPAETGPQRCAIARARNHAAAAGWVSPLAWDEDLDDPRARPHGILRDQEVAA
jgi:hypothetical protein